MRRVLQADMPGPIQRALERFGANIKVARLKRNLTAADLAAELEIHRSTYARVEAGDPMVALGLYAKALAALGFDPSFADIVDPLHDHQGLLFDLQRLPKRARKGGPGAVYRTARPAVRKAPRERVLRIGVLAAMSGPAASWGMVDKFCAETTAEMYNDAGGIDIDGEVLKIEIVAFDDQLTPSLAAEGARRLMEEEGVRYIIGPNVEQTLAAALPVAERNGGMLFPYSFTRSLYRPPHGNAVLAQVAGYQAAPAIYTHLIRTEGVQTISLVAPATSEGLRQRQEASRIAERLGLRILSNSSTYRVGSEHLEQAIEPAVCGKPDVLALTNVAPFDAARLIRRARELGFHGLITTESAQDVEFLLTSLGSVADGFVMVGGASLPESRSSRMQEFVRRYAEKAGSWNDEAGTKAYALEFVLGTLRAAGKSAIDDIRPFKSAIPSFASDDPFAKGSAPMSYFGAKDFMHKRQVGIPLVVNAIRGGKLQNLFRRAPEEFLA